MNFWTVLKRINAGCATYEVGVYSQFPGVRWRRVVADRAVDESQGAFYDDGEVGAVASAVKGAQKHAKKNPCKVPRRRKPAKATKR